MKRFYLFVLLFLVSLPVLAATKNKISMVTYFPVPYVAYSQVNTTDQMDIGLTSTCDMKLGCSEESATLNVAQVNLKGGKLNLDGGLGIKGYTLSLGSGSGEGKISFQNVRIQTGTMESVNAEDIKAANLNLFGKAFPSCKAANGDSEGQMQWASLKLKGASSSELYLMCGEGQASACNDEYGPWETASSGVVDTCDGDSDFSFYCGDNPNVGSCLDVVVEGGSDSPILLRDWESLALNGGTGTSYGKYGRNPGDCSPENGYSCFADTCNPLLYVEGRPSGSSRADQDEITSCSQVTAKPAADGSVTCWDVKGVDINRSMSDAVSYIAAPVGTSCSYITGGCLTGNSCYGTADCNTVYNKCGTGISCTEPKKRQIRCEKGITKVRRVTCCPK